MSDKSDQVVVVGAGPVGLVATAFLLDAVFQLR